MCERELETEQNNNILTPTLLAIITFLSRSPRLLNRGPGGPASLSAGFLYRILSPTHLQTADFLSSSGLYNDLTLTLLPSSATIALIQPVHDQSYNILIFFDRMHLLFTLVHFLFWQLCWVGGQYATNQTLSPYASMKPSY